MERSSQVDPQIEPGTRMTHVKQIVGQLATNTFQIGIGRQLYLGQTSYARPNQQPEPTLPYPHECIFVGA